MHTPFRKSWECDMSTRIRLNLKRETDAVRQTGPFAANSGGSTECALTILAPPPATRRRPGPSGSWVRPVTT